MSKNKQAQIPEKNEISAVRSSAAEYLTFVAASGHGGIEAVYADENVWLTQKMMGLLYDVETHTVNYHLKKVFADNELEEDAVIRNFRITAADGKSYNTTRLDRRRMNWSAFRPTPDAADDRVLALHNRQFNYFRLLSSLATFLQPPRKKINI